MEAGAGRVAMCPDTQMDLEDFGLNETLCGPDNKDHRVFNSISKNIQNRQVQRDRR